MKIKCQSKTVREETERGDSRRVVRKERKGKTERNGAEDRQESERQK